MSSFSSTDSSEEHQEKQCKYRKEKFNNKWLDDDNFSGWLEAVANDVYKCKCAACDKVLNCGKSDLQKRAETKMHKKNIKATKKTPKMNSFFKKNPCKPNGSKNFEIRLSMFFAEHNVALQVVDHLIPLLKEIVPDSEIIKNCELGRKKCTSIVKNVLAKVDKDNLVQKLKVNKFSLMIDESTDIGLNKHMCLLVRFFDEESERVVVKLLDLIPIRTDCTQKLCTEFLKNPF